MMQIEIHPAHGEAIVQRGQLLQALLMQFRLLQAEDKRHVDAVLKTLGQSPDDFEQYDLRPGGDGRYFLELKPKPKQQTPAVLDDATAAYTAKVNGAMQPEV